MVNEKNAVTVSELAELLGISESTVRRDVSLRENLMSEEKTEIARYSAKLINNSDFVFIDSGTTTSRLIDFIDNNKATYVTNGIVHARKLVQKGLNAYLIGGKVKAATEAVVGAEGIANIKSFNFSKAFMGANGIDIDSGFTTPEIEETEAIWRLFSRITPNSGGCSQ